MTAVFDPKRCAHVAGKLWRGNLPLLADRSFADSGLRRLMEIPDTAPYVNVSLIDNVEGSERDDWLVEMVAFDVKVNEVFPRNRPDIPPQFNQTDPPFQPGRYFSVGPKPRSLMWWQIEGGEDAIVLGPEPKSYNFIGLLERLGRFGFTPVYVHCMNGTDRTGAVVAAYGLRYLGLNLDEAFKLAASVPAAGTMNPDYVKLVTAYSAALGSGRVEE